MDPKKINGDVKVSDLSMLTIILLLKKTMNGEWLAIFKAALKKIEDSKEERKRIYSIEQMKVLAIAELGQLKKILEEKPGADSFLYLELDTIKNMVNSW